MANGCEKISLFSQNGPHVISSLRCHEESQIFAIVSTTFLERSRIYHSFYYFLGNIFSYF